ncbi:hypothetical protein K5I29_05510 [Flavobacterium agricola]|uniref:Uncharacterized protein n=1 Tax=Flavobacterium agricola TaxID=2870839 RepID=A0ABY6M3D6_9FLAO|nr:hypothetical protein [Flavobacterium agricola]UYW02355.1 hypothetical protein K5I29_05510 [Flavobacterium agricola]
MKYSLIVLISIFSYLSASAQIGIGKLVTNESVILDFDDKQGDNLKGIVLPIANIDAASVNYVDGSLLVDRQDKKVKVLVGGQWLSLTDEGSFDEVLVQGVVATTPALFMDGVENPANKIILGDQSSTAPGVVVLESETKALVLPKVASPHKTMEKPVAGTICYDTDNKMIAIFDGVVWSHWK